MHQSVRGRFLDLSNVIVQIKNKRYFNGYRCKNDEIESISCYYNQCVVKYKFNNRDYKYNKKNITISKFIDNFKITNDNFVTYQGNVLLNCTNVSRYENNLYVVWFSEHKFEIVENLEVTNNSHRLKLFYYYKALVNYASSQRNGEQDEIDEMLANQYQSINEISQKSILHGYLYKKPIEFIDYQPSNFIFPFAFNLSQKEAVEKTFKTNISVIEGPPGCGKTQTILNIIANLIINNKTAVIISNNNTAIENIIDKLKKSNLFFFVALLGKIDNRKNFFEDENQNTIIVNKNDVLRNINEHENINNLKIHLIESLDLMENLHKQQNLKYQYVAELSKLTKEYEHFCLKNRSNIKQIQWKKLASKKFLISIKLKLKNDKNFSWINKWKLRYKYKLNKELWIYYKDQLLTSVENQLYKVAINDLKKWINQIKKQLIKYDFVNLVKEYEEKSQDYFKKILSLKFSKISYQNFTIETYKQNFQDFVKRYPIILSTPHSLLSSIGKGYKFDYIIFDEASQSDLISSVLALSCAKNIVVVGDSQQLQPILNEKISQSILKHYAKEFKVSKAQKYEKNSLLSSIKGFYQNVPITDLKEHYRCHPKIIDFCNIKCYENKLIMINQDKNVKPFILIKTVPGNHARRNSEGTGQYNQREIDEISNLIKTLKYKDIGIISPFRIQIKKAQNILQDFPKKNIEIDTIHKFQGRQKEVIILTTVVNSLEQNEDKPNRVVDFINNLKLLNVAVSRAAKCLILVVADKVYHSKNNNINDLIKYIEYNSEKKYIKEGQVTSIFDFLYSDYTNELIKLKNKHKFVKESSELLMFDLLSKIFDQKFPNYFKFAMHVNLNKLIKIYEGFTRDEIKYLKHPLAHVDFLIYNNLTKEPIMAIEVDGIKYHEQNIKQTEKDLIKDKALKLNDILISRIKTNESNIEQKIISSLNSIIKIN